MKTHLLIGLTLFASGCGLVTQQPSETKARRLEDSRAQAENSSHIAAETKRLEDKGLSPREARSLAEAQARTTRP